MIVNHIVRLYKRPDGRQKRIDDCIQLAAPKSRNDIYPDVLIIFSVAAPVFFIIFFPGNMMTIPVISIHPVSFCRHSDGERFHNDFHAAFSRRNPLMANHGDFQARLPGDDGIFPGMISMLSGRRTVPASFFCKRD